MRYFWVVIAGFFLSIQVFAKDESSYAFIADAGVWNSKTQSVRDSIHSAGISKIIMAGDNIYDTRQSYSDVWKSWFNSGFQFPVVAIGNHSRGYAEEMQFFNMPGEFYSWVDSNARFLVLNSDHEDTADRQAVWLAQELEQAHEQFIFIVYHHSPVTLTTRHFWQEKKRFHEATVPVILKHQSKITAILVGHDHIASLVDFAGLPLVVSGSVFESRQSLPVDSQEHGFSFKTQWLFRAESYWTRLDLSASSGEVWLSFVRANSQEVSCRARIQPKPIVLHARCFQTGSPIR